MNDFSVCNTTIRQTDGLYNLNDLHKAAGAASKHQPAFFLRLDQTKELIAEIENENSADMQSLSTKTMTGRNGGTFVCRELVYAYAMWISPKFNLAVIRAFDQIQSSQTPYTLPEACNEFYSPIHKSALQDTGYAIIEENKYGSLTSRPVSKDAIDLLPALTQFLASLKDQGFLVMRPEELLKRVVG